MLKAMKLTSRNDREMNTRVLEHQLWENEEIRALRESFKMRTGHELREQGGEGSKFPVLSWGFNWQNVARKMGTSVKEADGSSGFVQVLRAGVQTVVNDMYKTVKTSFEDWVHVVPSDQDTELYAPLHGISFMKEVPKQGKYSEGHAAGLDIKLQNRKYGEIYPIEKELVQNDKTGQFNKQAGLMGEYAKLCLEVLVYAKLGGIASQYSEMTVPATETKPVTETGAYPYNATGLVAGGGINRPAAFTAPTQAAIQAAYIGLMNQKNALGLKMSVDGNRILTSPYYRFDIATLLNSAYWPAVPSASAGATGGAFSENPMKGLANHTVSRFMFDNAGSAANSKAWYLIDDSKPWFVLQVRESATVTQEAMNAGASFEKDVFRFKVNLQANADHIDPRFAWQGSDGSV